MKNKLTIFYCLVILLPFFGLSQNNTFSPYSRYGLGELTPSTLAHNAGMGGAYIALKPDSTMPVFINTGNPAAYALIKVTSLEVGGSALFSNFTSPNTTLKKRTTNFGYGVLGFPIRNNGGACFGIMPYSNVGYDSENNATEAGVGNINYKYSGTGGLNKAFLGYGVMPFGRRLAKFRRKYLNVPDSMKTLSRKQYRIRQAGSKLLTDLSLGVNANYVFGSIENTTRIIYPNSLIYTNTFLNNATTLGAFTGNFGAQTGLSVDSIVDKKKRRAYINREVEALKTSGFYDALTLQAKSDSIERNTGQYRRALKEKVKFTFGYFMALNNSLSASYNSRAITYVLDGSGQEVPADTILYKDNQSGTIKLPLEQGFGIGLKKGERINMVADFAITNWQNFKYLQNVNDFKNNYRVAVGINYVPEKYAAGNGAFFRKVNYRLGASYQTGYINVRNTVVSDMSVSAGVGLPVGIGRLSSMVNVSAQYGQMGTNANGLLKQNYWRINFGFTFSDRWFQKYRED